MSHDDRSAAPADALTGAAVGAWLRALATRADADPTFAAQMLAALRESGMASALTNDQRRAPRGARTRGSARSADRSADRSATPSAAATPPDPFSVYRAQGEERLRASLTELDLATLRAIVRSHRLDPARISARWTTRERVIALIVDQVRARANHGRAFERI